MHLKQWSNRRNHEAIAVMADTQATQVQKSNGNTDVHANERGLVAEIVHICWFTTSKVVNKKIVSEKSCDKRKEGRKVNFHFDEILSTGLSRTPEMMVAMPNLSGQRLLRYSLGHFCEVTLWGPLVYLSSLSIYSRIHSK